MTEYLKQPELSRIVRIHDIGNSEKELKLEATLEERVALSKRFDLPEIKALNATYELAQDADKISCEGNLSAELLQQCAISGELFAQTVSDDFDIVFIPHPVAGEQAEAEIELASEDCDQMFHDGQQIDVGEAVAQTLFLSLEPYPRGPNADEVARQKGLKSEEEAGPFGALAGLKDKLDERQTD